MNNKNKCNSIVKSAALLMLMLFVALASSCKFSLGGNHIEEKAVVKISTAVNQRTVYPDFDFSSLSEILIEVKSSTETVYSKSYSSVAELSQEAIELDPGTYTFIFTGRNGGTSIGGTKEQAVVSGQNSVVISVGFRSFNTLDNKNLGSFSAEIYYPGTAKVDTLIIQIQDLLNPSKYVNFDEDDVTFVEGVGEFAGKNGFKLTEKVPEGSYKLKIAIADSNAGKQASHFETLYVSKDKESKIIKELDAFVDVYTVKLMLDYGEIHSDVVYKNIIRYTPGIGYTLPSASEVIIPVYYAEQGVKFVGWYEDAECTIPATDGLPGKVSGNKTIYAKYSRDIVIDYVSWGTGGSYQANLDWQYFSYDTAITAGSKLKLTVKGTPDKDVSNMNLQVTNYWDGLWEHYQSFPSLEAGKENTLVAEVTLPDDAYTTNNLVFQIYTGEADGKITIKDVTVTLEVVELGESDIITYAESDHIKLYSTADGIVAYEKKVDGGRVTSLFNPNDSCYMYLSGNKYNYTYPFVKKDTRYTFKVFVYYDGLGQVSEELVIDGIKDVAVLPIDTESDAYQNAEIELGTTDRSFKLTNDIISAISEEIIDSVTGKVTFYGYNPSEKMYYNNLWVNFGLSESNAIYSNYQTKTTLTMEDMLSGNLEYDYLQTKGSEFSKYDYWTAFFSIEFSYNGNDFAIEKGNENPVAFTKPDTYILKFVTNCDIQLPDFYVYKFLDGSYIGLEDSPDNMANGSKVLEGWYFDEEFTEVADISSVEPGTYTMYAKWGDGVSIIFDSDGGTEYEPLVTVPGNTFYTGDNFVSQYNPYKEGYEFEGWYFEDGTKLQEYAAYVVTKNIVLKAAWIKLNKITFETDGGSTIEPIYVGSNYSLASDCFLERYSVWKKTDNGWSEDFCAAPVKDGYIFAGWYKEADCVNLYYVDDSCIITDDVTVYAKWEAACTVTIDGVGLYTVPANTQFDGSDFKYVYFNSYASYKSIIIPQKAGFIYNGISTVEDGDPLTSSYLITSDVTLYPLYAAVKQVIYSDMVRISDDDGFECSFTVKEGSIYKILWADSVINSNAYESDTKVYVEVSAMSENNTYFSGAAGHTDGRTITAYVDETITVNVKPCWDGYTGDCYLWIYEMPGEKASEASFDISLNTNPSKPEPELAVTKNGNIYTVYLVNTDECEVRSWHIGLPQDFTYDDYDPSNSIEIDVSNYAPGKYVVIANCYNGTYFETYANAYIIVE